MRVTVRCPGHSTQPVTRVRKRAEDGLLKRSVKRSSSRSHAMTGGSSRPGRVPAGDAEDIVSKSAPPWIGRGTTVPTRTPPPLLLHPQRAGVAYHRQAPLVRHESAKVHSLGVVESAHEGYFSSPPSRSRAATPTGPRHAEFRTEFLLICLAA